MKPERWGLRLPGMRMNAGAGRQLLKKLKYDLSILQNRHAEKGWIKNNLLSLIRTAKRFRFKHWQQQLEFMSRMNRLSSTLLTLSIGRFICSQMIRRHFNIMRG